jgi:DNA-binding TFAR19-related protein (PDSD5 family)
LRQKIFRRQDKKSAEKNVFFLGQNGRNRHDIDEILLKMALSAIKQTVYAFIVAVIIYM